MISANGVTLRVGKKALFEDVNIKFTEGNCYGLIGANGAGKSTFLKILSGALEPTNGSIVITPGQRLSVLEQDHFKYDDCVVLDTVMMGNARLFEVKAEREEIYANFTEEDGIRAAELEEEFANMNGWEAEADAATLLNGLGIDTELHSKLMGELNGSEKVKVLLARALFGNPDILLLDEPTNHLDLAAIDWLEEFLINFENTVIVVSHDRYFINQTATRILDLTNQAIVNYIGNYDYYLEKREELTEKYAPAAAQAEAEVKQASDNKLSWQQQKEEQARQRKRENELKKVEARIEELETRDKEIDETMVLPEICTNVAECARLSKEKTAITEELEGLYEKWEELA